MPDIINLERALVRQMQNLRRKRETARGPKDNAVAANSYMTFKDTLSILEEHGPSPEIRTMAIRLREDY